MYKSYCEMDKFIPEENDNDMSINLLRKPENLLEEYLYIKNKTVNEYRRQFLERQEYLKRQPRDERPSLDARSLTQLEILQEGSEDLIIREESLEKIPRRTSSVEEQINQLLRQRSPNKRDWSIMQLNTMQDLAEVLKERSLSQVPTVEKLIMKSIEESYEMEENYKRKLEYDLDSSSSDEIVPLKEDPSFRTQFMNRASFKAAKAAADHELLIEILRNRSDSLEKILEEAGKEFEFDEEDMEVYKRKKIKPKGMIDIDKDYFKLIQKRSKKERKHFRMSDYKSHIQQTLRTNVVTGFRRDDILRTNRILKIEARQLHFLNLNLHTLLICNDEFLYDDYCTSMDIVTGAAKKEAETKVLKEILIKKEEASRKIKNEVYLLRDLYEKYIDCANFLTTVTPPHKLLTDDSSPEVKTSTSKLTSFMSTMTLDGLVENTIKEMKNNKRRLYFTDTDDTFDIIRNYVKQDTKFFQTVVKFRKRVKQHQIWCLELIDDTLREVEEFMYTIEEVETRTKELKELTEYHKVRFQKLIKEDFRRRTICKECIIIRTWIASVHKHILGTQGTKILEDSYDLFGYIKEEYERTMVEADKLPKQLFEETLEEVCATAKRAMKDAQVAKRIITRQDYVRKSAMKLLDKPKRITCRKLMERSALPHRRRTDMPEPDLLTAEEKIRYYLLKNICPPELRYSFRNPLLQDEIYSSVTEIMQFVS